MKMTFQPKKRQRAKSSWIQTENENCWRKKSNRSKKIKRKKKKIISISTRFLWSFSSFLIVFRRTASNEIFRFVEKKQGFSECI